MRINNKFFIFLFFILSISLVSSYRPGEKINLNFTNITDVDYPCILINHTVYLDGSIDTGNVSCEVTYYAEYEEVDSSSTSGGGGGGGSTTYATICGNWSICYNYTKSRPCAKGSYKYNQTTSCRMNITVSIEEDVEHPIVKTDTIPIEVGSVDNNNTHDPKQNDNGVVTKGIPPNNSAWPLILGVVFIIIAIGGIILIIIFKDKIF